MEGRPPLVESLAQTALFADLTPAQLDVVAHTYDEEVYPEGQRVLRQGLSGSGLYVIVDGEAVVTRDGEEVARLGRGDFFGEISVFGDEIPRADVTAATMLRCLVIPRPDVEPFLLERPKVMLRMLKIEAVRLRRMLEALS